ncbi:MAG: hypothetical protein C0468_06120 [Planctomyces sp.]|nr:hypothetical protein [Planctomyces sp.]
MTLQSQSSRPISVRFKPTPPMRRAAPRQPWVRAGGIALAAAALLAVIYFVFADSRARSTPPATDLSTLQAPPTTPPAGRPSDGPMARPASVPQAGGTGAGANTDANTNNAAAGLAAPSLAATSGAATTTDSATTDAATIDSAAAESAAVETLGAAPAPLPGSVARALESAQRDIAAGRLVEARTALNAQLMDTRLSPSDRAGLKAQIQALNQRLFFGPQAAPNDPLTDTHTVASGDSLIRIVQRQSLPVDWRFLQRINQLRSPSALRVGQTLKVVRTPVHAVVHKDRYRMDLWAGPGLPPGASGFARLGPEGQAEGWTFIASFPVGLGELDGTPEGLFALRRNSKLTDPRWVNPRTGQVFEPSDPKNPIGEHWIGLAGIDQATRVLEGYGIHGTIDPQSIGDQRSLGCVRMHAEDVALVYELLVERLSTVRIAD